MDAPTFRLNFMQALMRRFAELAPYNFVHAMRIVGIADVRRWREAATQTLAELHLGPPKFEGDRVSFPTPAPAVVEIVSGNLDGHLDAELNRPFSPGDTPLRFFVIEETDGTHWFGVVLDHWVADDFSCRQLLHRIFLRYHAPAKAAALPPLAFTPGAEGGTALSAMRSLPMLLRRLADHRQAVRVSLGDPMDFTVRAFQHSLPNGLVAAIRGRAKEDGATVHDFFLAACARACGELSRAHGKRSRESVGLATVASLRRDWEHDSSRASAFGCELSYYTSILHHPESAPASDLLRAITSRTRQFKRDLRTTAATLHFARLWWDRSRSAHAKATLFQRGMPNVCGLSNVNLIGSWIDQAYPTLREYRRAGPAGPIAPLVFMLTSIADRLSLNVTYRTTAFTRGDADQLAVRFSEYLQTLAG